MGYQLGVDLGTTYTAAAVWRNGKVEACTLGATGPVIPSVVLLRASGEVLIGDAAVRRGLSEPTRVGREFKRRLGDPAPLVLGGTPYGAEALMGHLLRAVVQLVVEREGSTPDRVVLTHPANYGPYKMDMMREVARQAGLDLGTTSFVTEPEAAAISYAARNRVEPGEIVAVYDLGGGTFDAAVLQRTDTGFALVGRPEGMDRFGGIDIDSAILGHVDEMLGGAIRSLDPDDPAVQNGVARLRDDCRAAKEALSVDTDTSIDVSVPGLQTQVRLTRRELEDMSRPRLNETIAALDRAVRSAGLTLDQISRVLLVGGSSRMPLVAETILHATNRPVAVDAHPKFAVAFGAAAFGEVLATAAPTESTSPSPSAWPKASPAPTTSALMAPNAVAPPAERLESSGASSPTWSPAVAETPTPGSVRRRRLIAVGAAVVLLVGGVAVLASRGGHGSSAATGSSVASVFVTQPPVVATVPAATAAVPAATVVVADSTTSTSAAAAPLSPELTFTDRVGYFGDRDLTLFRVNLTKAQVAETNGLRMLKIDGTVTNYSLANQGLQTPPMAILAADGTQISTYFSTPATVPGGGTTPATIIVSVGDSFDLSTSSLTIGNNASNQTILPFDTTKPVSSFSPIEGIGKGVTGVGGSGTVITITDGILHHDYTDGMKDRYRLDLYLDATFAPTNLEVGSYDQLVFELMAPDGTTTSAAASYIYSTIDDTILESGSPSRLGFRFAVPTAYMGDYTLVAHSRRVSVYHDPGAVDPTMTFAIAADA